MIGNEIIGPERFEIYRTGPDKDSKLGIVLTKASELAGIGALALDVFGGAAKRLLDVRDKADKVL